VISGTVAVAPRLADVVLDSSELSAAWDTFATTDCYEQLCERRLQAKPPINALSSRPNYRSRFDTAKNQSRR
jgi:hypothetical protein